MFNHNLKAEKHLSYADSLLVDRWECVFFNGKFSPLAFSKFTTLTWEFSQLSRKKRQSICLSEHRFKTGAFGSSFSFGFSILNSFCRPHVQRSWKEGDKGAFRVLPGDSSRDRLNPKRCRSLNLFKRSRFHHPIKVTKNCQVQFPDTFVFGALPKPWFTVDRNTY